MIQIILITTVFILVTVVAIAGTVYLINKTLAEEERRDKIDEEVWKRTFNINSKNIDHEFVEIVNRNFWDLIK